MEHLGMGYWDLLETVRANNQFPMACHSRMGQEPGKYTHLDPNSANGKPVNIILQVSRFLGKVIIITGWWLSLPL